MNKNSKNLFLVLLLCIFTLIGCKSVETILVEKNLRVQTEKILKEFTVEGLTIKNINLDTLEDDSIKTLLSEKDSTHGIYVFEIQGENKDLIYFNGIDSNFSNLEFSMDNNTLIITSKVEELKENTTNKTLLLLEKTENSTVQSVKAKISELTPGTTTIYDF